MNKVCLYGFADEAGQSAAEQIRALSENGMDGLEIRATEYGNVSELTEAEAKEFRAAFDAAGLRIRNIGSPIGKIRLGSDDWNAHQDLFRHTLEIARILGADRLRLFSFYPPEGVVAEDCRNEVIERMNRLAELAAGSGILLCHENEKGIYGDIASRCLTLAREVPSIKAIFDPANFVQCGQDTTEAWRMLSPYVEYMHIKDALSDGTVVPAGRGAGHLAELVTAYRAQGGTDFTLEPHLVSFIGLAALEQGERTKIGGRYDSPAEAFHAAADALKALLEGDFL